MSDPISRLARSFGDYTVVDAARLVGRSAATLTRWRKRGIYEPSGLMRCGTIWVHVYTDEDIDRMRALVKTIRPGPDAQRPAPKGGPSLP